MGIAWGCRRCTCALHMLRCGVGVAHAEMWCSSGVCEMCDDVCAESRAQ